MRCLALAAAAAIAAVTLSACGEKAEPSLDSLKSQYQQEQRRQHRQKQAILGSYKGTLHQQGRKPFAIQVTITSLKNAKDNVVHYGGIDCSGTWSFTTQKGDAYLFHEVIDRGAGGQCKGAGTVSLTPTADSRLDYEFNGGGVTSRGVLEPTG